MLSFITGRVPATIIPVAFVCDDSKPQFVPIAKAPLGKILGRASRKLRLLSAPKPMRGAAEGRA